MTIQECLTLRKAANQQLNFLEKLVHQTTSLQGRVVIGDYLRQEEGIQVDSIVKYEKPMYAAAQLNGMVVKLRSLIQQLDNAINKTNATVQVENAPDIILSDFTPITQS